MIPAYFQAMPLKGMLGSLGTWQSSAACSFAELPQSCKVLRFSEWIPFDHRVKGLVEDKARNSCFWDPDIKDAVMLGPSSVLLVFWKLLPYLEAWGTGLTEDSKWTY